MRADDPAPERMRPIAGWVAQPLVEPALWETVEWAARWTMRPIAQILESFLQLGDLRLEPGPGPHWMRTPALPTDWVWRPNRDCLPPTRRPASEAWRRVLDDDRAEADRLTDLYRDPAALIRRWVAEGRLVAAAAEPPQPPDLSRPSVTLQGDQIEADRAIAALQAAGDHATALLEGVTGSGKTEVYAEAARRALASNRQVLVLVPEISLAGPTAERLARRLGVPVWLWHSAISGGLRARARSESLRGLPGVLVGPRSAAWAPLPALGLVVVDEEHDPAYADRDGGGLHARDAAVRRARAAGVPAILASATPSMESAAAARAGRITWLRLRARPSGALLPDVVLVDTDRRGERGPYPWLGRTLEAAIDRTLAEGRQVVLFRNRRGYHPVVQCGACRETLRCPTCAADLTLHGRPRELRCHLCGMRTPWAETCPLCDAEGRLRPIGTGTQRIEHELAERWPTARIDRLDRDILTSQGRIDEVLRRLAAGETDILVGTQLVTKGLDVERITLVGVIQVDGALHVPDFRAAERVFQQLCQVSGRAGRGAHPGQVLIQTSQPDHPVLRFALEQDVDGFTAHELENRRRVGLPPARRLIRLVWEGEDEQALGRAVEAALRQGEAIAPARVLGPAPCPIERIRGTWRQHAFGLDDDFGRLRRWARMVADHSSCEVDWQVEPQQIQ